MGVTRFCRVRRLKVSGCYWQCQNMLVKHIKCNIVVIHGHRVLICWLWGRRPSPWALPEPTVWPQSVRFGQRFAMVCMFFFLFNDYERRCWSCKSIISYHLVSYSTELRTALEDWPNWIRSFEQHVLAISSRLLPCFFYNLLYVIPHCQAETDRECQWMILGSYLFNSIHICLRWCMMFIDVWCNRYWSTQICQQFCPRSKRWSWYGTTKEGKSFYGFEGMMMNDILWHTQLQGG
jgi:hypothetical protein